MLMPRTPILDAQGDLHEDPDGGALKGYQRCRDPGALVICGHLRGGARDISPLLGL